MKRFLSLVVLAACLPMAQAKDASPAKSKNLASVKIRVIPEADGYLQLEVQADKSLENLTFSFDGEAPQPSVFKEGAKSVYRMKFRRHNGAGRSVRIVAEDSASKFGLLATGKIVHRDGVARLEEKPRVIDDPAKLVQKAPQPAAAATTAAASPAPSLGGHQQSFLSLVNRYRAGRGLNTLTYDGGLENIARINNRRGGGHRYTGGTAQIWAAGSGTASGAFQQWRNSRPHNNIMLGGYSRMGVHFDGVNWTANFR